MRHFRHLYSLVFLLTILLFFSKTYGQKDIPYAFGLSPGQYKVGFKTIYEQDTERKFKPENSESEIFRPIQINIWYPSLDTVQKPMLYEEYVWILATEECSHEPTDSLKELSIKKLIGQFGNTKGEIENIIKQETKSIKSGNAAFGKFPIVVYAPSQNGSAFENTVICEYLSSYGYIVATVPSMGINSRYSKTRTITDYEAQAKDIEYLYNYLKRFPNTDTNNVAIIGYSRGGLANVIVKMKNNFPKVLISLDGSIGYEWHYNTINTAPYFNSDKINIPFLFIRQKILFIERFMKGRTQKTFFKSLKYSDAYFLVAKKMLHPNFSSTNIQLLDRQSFWESDKTKIIKSYKAVCLYSLNFLNFYLKNNTDASEFIKRPQQNGIKKKFLKIKTIKRGINKSLTGHNSGLK